LYAPGAFVTSSGISGGVSSFAGTSQATPLSAGCATAIRARVPGATPAQVEAALKASPSRVTDAKNGLQFPRLDCEDAAVRIDGLFANGFES
jgi:subtilisin family serine protease